MYRSPSGPKLSIPPLWFWLTGWGMSMIGVAVVPAVSAVAVAVVNDETWRLPSVRVYDT